jgi:hypothetical protein
VVGALLCVCIKEYQQRLNRATVLSGQPFYFLIPLAEIWAQDLAVRTKGPLRGTLATSQLEPGPGAVIRRSVGAEGGGDARRGPGDGRARTTWPSTSTTWPTARVAPSPTTTQTPSTIGLGALGLVEERPRQPGLWLPLARARAPPTSRRSPEGLGLRRCRPAARKADTLSGLRQGTCQRNRRHRTAAQKRAEPH